MFLVFNERNGYIVKRCHDILTAQRVALDYTEQHSWVSGDKFDVRVG